MYEVNFKLDYCCSALGLGLAANQKGLKYTFKRCLICHVFKQHRAGFLNKCEHKLSATLAKSYQYLQTLGK